LTGLKRGETAGPLSAAGVDAVFRTAKDAVGKTEAAQPAEQVVFRVTDIVVPALDMASDQAKRTLQTLKRHRSEEIRVQYVARFEREVGFATNKNAPDQVAGGGAGHGAKLPRPWRASRKPRHLPSATRGARPRASGPRSCRTSRRRCRLSSRSPPCGR